MWRILIVAGTVLILFAAMFLISFEVWLLVAFVTVLGLGLTEFIFHVA